MRKQEMDIIQIIITALKDKMLLIGRSGQSRPKDTSDNLGVNYVCDVCCSLTCWVFRLQYQDRMWSKQVANNDSKSNFDQFTVRPLPFQLSAAFTTQKLSYTTWACGSLGHLANLQPKFSQEIVKEIQYVVHKI